MIELYFGLVYVLALKAVFFIELREFEKNMDKSIRDNFGYL
jgi:hypothetical protein